MLDSWRTLPGQSVGHQGPQRHRIDAHPQSIQPLAVLAHEVTGQEGDVFSPLAQRRQLVVQDVEPVEQVLAEGAVTDGRLQVPIGGGDDADVHFDGLIAADALEASLLEGPQQASLEPDRDLSHFVEEEGAAVGGLETSDLTSHGAGKGAALVTKKLTFQQRLRQGGAVDLHKTVRRPAGWRDAGPRHQLFAGA